MDNHNLVRRAIAWLDAGPLRSRGLAAGSPPPVRAATEISRMILVKILPRFASCAFLRCWMFAHLE